VIRVALAACLFGLLAADGASGLERSSDAPLPAKTTFQDTRGEDPQGPDITTVVVSTGADLRLTFRVSIPSRPTLTEDMRVRIWLDADDDRTTGLAVDDRTGLDHFLLVDRWELGLGVVGLFVCSDSTCSGGKDFAARASIDFSYEDGATFSLTPAALGINRLERVRFSVETMGGVAFDPAAHRYDFTNAHRDVAPDQGAFWTFESRPLVVRGFSPSPAVPRGGKQFSLRLSAIRTDTGAALSKGKVSCSFTTAGRKLKPRTGGFVGRRAVCVFVVPMGTKGQRFRSSISVRVGGNSIARSLSGTIG
jgi:hypothetical protein